LQIFSEVAYFGLASSLQVEVEPPQEKLFDWELGELFQGLAIIEKSSELRAGFKDDFLGGDAAENLPHEGKDLMRRPVDEILSADTRQPEAFVLGGGDTHIQILHLLEETHILVGGDCGLDDAIFVENAQQLAHDNTVVHCNEEVLALRVERNAVSQGLVILEVQVDRLAVGGHLFKSVRVCHIVFLDLEHEFVLEVLGLAAPIRVVGDVDVAQADLVRDHEFLELLPADDAVLVLVDLTKESAHVFVGDGAVAHGDHASFELALIN
jgi:hypothetical protein